MRSGALILSTLLVGGCTAFQKGVIRSGQTTVVGVKDSGKPATLAESRSDASLPLPAGSKLVVTKFEPVAAVPAAEGRPEVAAQPAREVTEVVLSKDSAWNRTETRVQADTGTIDTSVAKHRIDAAESRYLLFAALGAAIAGGVFLYLKYPTPAMMCGAASVVFFLAWKLSDLPSWFYVVGVAAIAGGIFLWKGHHRGEKDGIKSALNPNDPLD